jgi:hypothetical protein
MPAVFRGEGGMETESDSEMEEIPDGQNTTLKLDEWVGFRVDAEAAHLALQLRQKWHSLFLRRMRAPAKPWSQVRIDNYYENTTSLKVSTFYYYFKIRTFIPQRSNFSKCSPPCVLCGII